MASDILSGRYNSPTVWNSLLTEFRDLSVDFADFRRTFMTILFTRY